MEGVSAPESICQSVNNNNNNLIYWYTTTKIHGSLNDNISNICIGKQQQTIFIIHLD